MVQLKVIFVSTRSGKENYLLNVATKMAASAQRFSFILVKNGKEPAAAAPFKISVIDGEGSCLPRAWVYFRITWLVLWKVLLSSSVYVVDEISPLAVLFKITGNKVAYCKDDAEVGSGAETAIADLILVPSKDGMVNLDKTTVVDPAEASAAVDAITKLARGRTLPKLICGPVLPENPDKTEPSDPAEDEGKEKDRPEETGSSDHGEPKPQETSSDTESVRDQALGSDEVKTDQAVAEEHKESGLEESQGESMEGNEVKGDGTTSEATDEDYHSAGEAVEARKKVHFSDGAESPEKEPASPQENENEYVDFTSDDENN